MVQMFFVKNGRKSVDLTPKKNKTNTFSGAPLWCVCENFRQIRKKNLRNREKRLISEISLHQMIEESKQCAVNICIINQDLDFLENLNLRWELKSFLDIEFSIKSWKLEKRIWNPKFWIQFVTLHVSNWNVTNKLTLTLIFIYVRLNIHDDFLHSDMARLQNLFCVARLANYIGVRFVFR